MNTDMEKAIKSHPTCPDHLATEPKDKVMSHEIPGRLWECVGADIFTINNDHYLCFVDYHRTFQCCEKGGGIQCRYLNKNMQD